MDRPDLTKAVICSHNCTEHGSNLYALEAGGIYCLNGHMVGTGYGHGPEFDAAAYYSVGDGHETLSHESPDEALIEAIDNCWDPKKTATQIVESAMPLDVCAWKRKDKPQTYGAMAIECMMERLEEDWAEEYGDFDGDYPPWPKEVREQVMADVQAVLDKYLAQAHVWQCEVVATVEFSVDDVKELLGDYLAEGESAPDDTPDPSDEDEAEFNEVD